MVIHNHSIIQSSNHSVIRHSTFHLKLGQISIAHRAECIGPTFQFSIIPTLHHCESRHSAVISCKSSVGNRHSIIHPFSHSIVIGSHSIIQSFNHSIKHLILFVFLLSSALVLTSCSDHTADHEKFVNAYVEIRIAEDTSTAGNKDIQKLKAEVFKKYHMTEEQYQSAFEYYNKNPELWEKFYNDAIARVDSLKKKK